MTLEFSGEMVVAADYLGVPHNPGYPLWTVLAWFYQWIFHFVEFRGYPNPARPVALMSAVFAAASVGLVAMLISSGGRRIVAGLHPASPPRLTRYRPLVILLGFAWMVLVFFASLVGLVLALLVLVTGLVGVGVLRYYLTQPANRSGLGGLAFGAVFGIAVGIAYAIRYDGLSEASLVLTAGGIAMIIDQLIGWIQRNPRTGAAPLNASAARAIPVFAGISAALLFAFSPTLWSQAVIVHTHTLNLFIALLLLTLTYIWMLRPESHSQLYALAFLFGLGLTNNYQLLLLGPVLLAAIFLRNRKLFWAILSVVLLLSALYYAYTGVAMVAREGIHEYRSDRIRWDGIDYGWATAGYLVAALLLSVLPGIHAGERRGLFRQVLFTTTTVLYLFAAGCCAIGVLGDFDQGRHIRIALVPVGLLLALMPIFLHRHPPWPRVHALLGLGLFGLCFFLFLPIASEQNPPMNWGYPRTFDGFKHTITRGSYENITFWRNVRRTAQRLFPSPPPTHDSRPLPTLETTRLKRNATKRALQTQALNLAREEALAADTPGAATNRLNAARDKHTAAVLDLQKAANEFDQKHKSRFFLFYQFRHTLFGTQPEHDFSMIRHFGLGLSLFVLLAFSGLLRLHTATRGWLLLTVGAMAWLSVSHLNLYYPNLSHPDLFIKRVFYFPVHAMWTLLIGYGLVLSSALLLSILKKIPLPLRTPVHHP